MSDAIVTGLGIVAPTGIGVEDYWTRTLAGDHAIRPMNSTKKTYSCTLAGQIESFDASAWISSQLRHQTDVSTRYALAAAQLALEDCGGDLGSFGDFDQGVVTSTATGGFEFTHREFDKLWQEGPASVSVYESFAWFYAVNTGQISIRHGMRGPGHSLVAEQAGGIDALGRARELVMKNTPFILAGGVDSSLDPWGWVSHISSGRLSKATSAEAGFLPFDRRANGYVPGEGGAMLVLEDRSSAGRRGAAHRYGEIAGYASTFDGYDAQGGPDSLARAVRLALEEAGLDPADVDAVFADASGVPELDASEAEALYQVFGARIPPVTAPKTGTGRLYAGGGPLDVATALLAMRDGLLPPTPLTRQLRADCPIDLVVDKPRPCPIGAAVVLARGRLGFNSALVLTRVD
jgi:act minimal PKS chain-length factor (CLF/KS beta)